jgi:hypothetical protein
MKEYGRYLKSQPQKTSKVWCVIIMASMLAFAVAIEGCSPRNQPSETSKLIQIPSKENACSSDNQPVETYLSIPFDLVTTDSITMNKKTSDSIGLKLLFVRVKATRIENNELDLLVWLKVSSVKSVPIQPDWGDNYDIRSADISVEPRADSMTPSSSLPELRLIVATTQPRLVQVAISNSNWGRGFQIAPQASTKKVICFLMRYDLDGLMSNWVEVDATVQ